MLPDIEGIEVGRRLRARGFKTAVLFLTAKDATENKVEALRAGRRRLRDEAVQPRRGRRADPGDPAPHRRALCPATSSASPTSSSTRTGTRSTAASTPIELTATEFSLLRYFMLNPRRVLAKGRSCRTSGATTSAATRTSSRRTSATCAGSSTPLGPPLIKTVRQAGYMLEAERLGMLAPALAARAPRPRRHRPRRRRPRRRERRDVRVAALVPARAHRRLARRVRALGSKRPLDHGQCPGDRNRGPSLRGAEPGDYVEVRAADGEPPCCSPSRSHGFGEAPPVAAGPAVRRSRSAEAPAEPTPALYFTASTPDGDRYRVRASPVDDFERDADRRDAARRRRRDARPPAPDRAARHRRWCWSRSLRSASGSSASACARSPRSRATAGAIAAGDLSQPRRARGAGHRGRPARARAQRDARPDRGGVPRPGGIRAEAAALRRRRVARAAHAARRRARVRGALHPRRRPPARRPRALDDRHHARVRAHEPARRRPAPARAARRGPAARARARPARRGRLGGRRDGAGRSSPSGRSSWSRSPRSCSATATACGRSSTTCSRTCARTRRPGRPSTCGSASPNGAAVIDVEDSGPGSDRGRGRARLRALLPRRRVALPRERRRRARPVDRRGRRARRTAAPSPRRRARAAAPPSRSRSTPRRPTKPTTRSERKQT